MPSDCRAQRPITRVSLVKLRRDVERQTALELWLGPHADIVRGLPGVCHYSIALAETPRAPGAWDAVATLRFASREQMVASLEGEETRHALARTREPFLDQVDAFVVEEHVAIGASCRP